MWVIFSSPWSESGSTALIVSGSTLFLALLDQDPDLAHQNQCGSGSTTLLVTPSPPPPPSFPAVLPTITIVIRTVVLEKFFLYNKKCEKVPIACIFYRKRRYDDGWLLGFFDFRRNTVFFSDIREFRENFAEFLAFSHMEFRTYILFVPFLPSFPLAPLVEKCKLDRKIAPLVKKCQFDRKIAPFGQQKPGLSLYVSISQRWAALFFLGVRFR